MKVTSDLKRHIVTSIIIQLIGNTLQYGSFVNMN